MGVERSGNIKAGHVVVRLQCHLAIPNIQASNWPANLATIDSVSKKICIVVIKTVVHRDWNCLDSHKVFLVHLI